MRYKQYKVESPLTGVHTITFTPSHYKYKGLRTSSLGMPALEALELINEWNKQNAGYKYWLEGQ